MPSPKDKNKLDETSEALATRGETAVEEFDFAAYRKDAGKGFENNKQDLMKLPLLKLQQSGSPIIKLPTAQRPPHLLGLEAGDFLDTITEEFFKGGRSGQPGDRTGLEVIPCHYERCYIAWEKDLGGFVAKYPEDDARVRQIVSDRSKFGEWEIDGHDLIETVELYVGYKSPKTGAWATSVISLTSTALTPFKDWNGKCARFVVPDPTGGEPYTFPLFAHRTLIYSTFVPENKPTPSYFKFGMEPAVLDKDGRPSFRASLLSQKDPRYALAAAFQKAAAENAAAADYATAGPNKNSKADDVTDSGFKAKSSTGF